MQRATPIVLNLIIINVLVFIAQRIMAGTAPVNTATDLFALHHYKSDLFKPVQLVTHQFMHASITHLLFNMFALWMFGSMVETHWGPKRFLSFYLICGIGSALMQLGAYAVEFREVDKAVLNADLMSQYQNVLRMSYAVGASGAIMGVVAGFGFLFPNLELLMMPIPFPVKAKFAVGIWIGIDLFGGLARRPGDNVAHFAHLGGAIAGLLLAWYWKRSGRRNFY